MRTSASPSLPPSSRCDLSAASNCSWVMSFALRRRSPSLTAMGKEDAKAWGSQQSTADSRQHLSEGAFCELYCRLSTVDCGLVLSVFSTAFSFPIKVPAFSFDLIWTRSLRSSAVTHRTRFLSHRWVPLLP